MDWGLHSPLQLPASHTYKHGVEASQSPAALQVSGVASAQRAWFGRQLPMHDPALQMWGQTWSSTHEPSAPHVCSVLPLHCLLPPVHMLTQVPFSQTVGQGAWLDH
jgi:hypothetical protein